MISQMKETLSVCSPNGTESSLRRWWAPILPWWSTVLIAAQIKQCPWSNLFERPAGVNTPNKEELVLLLMKLAQNIQAH